MKFVRPLWHSWLLLGMVAACGAEDTTPPFAAGGAGGGSQTTAGNDGSGGRAGSAGAPVTASDSLWCGVKATLDASCTSCHDGKRTAGAPMSLKAYSDLQQPAPSNAARKVYELVGTRVHDKGNPMPPQKQLTAAELQNIDAWLAAGALSGEDPTCAGQASTEPPKQDPWPTDCDATYQLLAHGPSGESAAYMVPAGEELHPKIAVQAPWGNEAMQGIAFRPITDNAKVLHHWILYGPKKEFLVGWAPGKDNVPLPADVGMNLAGGALTLDMHYNNLGGTSAEPDNSGVEICVLKKEHFRKNTASVHMGFTQLLFSIPARASDYEVTGQCTVTSTAPVTLISASPHAHTLATHMRFEVQKSSGERILMHNADFRFEEQQSYALAQPVVLEKGDTVLTTCTYTNPSARAVTFGEDTGNEMCFNFASYYPMGGLKCGLQYGSR